MNFGFESHRPTPRRRRPTTKLRLNLEPLETREVPATLLPINDFTTPNGKVLYVPLTVTDVTGAVTYTATSSDSQVQVQSLTGGTTIKLNVSGTGGNGQPFQGDLTFRLFDSLAPVTVDRIVSLVEQGFYDDLTFHRVIDGFVAQGGDPSGNGTGGSGVKLDDEYNTLLTFNSPGLLAMANSGDDTGDSQFFITDTDLTLAQQPQHLNFNHTIFGQLVAGFDTFTSLMSTPVGNPQLGDPVNPVTINSATVVQNDPNGVLVVTAPANFTGASTITVTPTDAGTAGTGEPFQVTFVQDTNNDLPFLGPVADQTTTAGTAAVFPLTATDIDADPLTFSVLSATSNGQAVNVQTSIDQTTGRATVTPPAGFTGTIDLKFQVKETAGNDTRSDSQVAQLTVNASPPTFEGSFDLDSTSDTGVLNDDNVTGTNTPSLAIQAPAGRTVAVTVNGAAAGTATETSTAGVYRITLPAGLLRVGANTLAGTATGGTGAAADLTPFTLTYNPSLAGVYVVPGAVGASTTLAFQLGAGEAKFSSELGYYKADDASGKIGTLNPGDAGYAAAALARRSVVFLPGAAAGTSTTVTVNGGEFLVMYIVQNGTSTALLASNPNNLRTGAPLAFFGLTAANPDATAHLSGAADPAASQAIYGWEDFTGGGDRDFNDAIVSVRPSGSTLSPTLTVPAGPGRPVKTVAQVEATATSENNSAPTTKTSTDGEIGVIVADDASGKIGTLNPGDAGYAAAALARRRVLFAPNSAESTTTTLTTLTGGQNLVFYYIPGGTSEELLATNPTNAGTGDPVAYFSVAAANPDGEVHARYFNPEGVARRTLPGTDDPYWIHMMGTFDGGPEDFDDVLFTVKFQPA